MPFISVIINAYNRRDYLLNAVSSVLDQTLPQDKFEIIVIKNFQDPEIDEFLEKHEVKQILEKSPFWNISLYAALEKAHGEVLSFLDDDDYFNKEKLERISQIFSNEDIVFCKNGTAPVDDHGNVIKGYRNSTTETSYFCLKEDGSFVGNKGYLSLFNSSSMSMLKKPLLEHLKVLNKSIGNRDGCRYAMDNFLCFVSLESGNCMVIPEKLTFYRHHVRQLTVNKTTASDFYRKKENLEKAYRHSYSTMKGAFRTEPVLRKLEDMVTQSDLQVSILSYKETGLSPNVILKAVRNLLSSHEKYLLVLLSIYLLSVFSTSLSLLVYKNMITKLSRLLN